MRLQKFLRDNGIGALRKCDELIQAKKVFVNNARLIDPTYYLKEGDLIKIGNKKLIFTEHKSSSSLKHFYCKFHKPRLVLSAHSDERGRKVIFDYIDRKSLVFIKDRCFMQADWIMKPVV